MASEYKIAIHIAGQLEKSLGGAVDDANRVLAGLGKGGSNVNKILSGAGKATTAVLKTSAGMLTGTLAAMGTGAKYAVDIGQEFESAMAAAAATAGVDKTSEEYEKMEQAARAAGATTSKTAAESANALEYMALAGWDVQTSVDNLPNILHLSEATGLDLATTSDMVTDSMAAMGVGIGDLTGYLDVLAKAQNKSNMKVQEEMAAMIKVGGTMQDLGVNYADTATALGLFADKGKKSAQAGRAMNSIMTNLKATSGQSAKAMEELGFSMYDEQGNFKGMEQAFQELHDKLAAVDSQERRNQLTDMLGGKQYGSELSNFLRNFDVNEETGLTEWQQLSAEIENSAGAMEQMRDTKLDTLVGDLDRLKSAVQDMSISFYDAFNSDMREGVQWMVDKVNEMSTAFETGGWDSFSDTLSQAVVGASVKFGSGADEIIDKAGTLVIDLLSAFSSEENRPLVAATAQGVIDSFATNVLAISGQLVDTGLSLLDELLNGMADENAISKLTDAANDMITQIKTGFTEHGDSISDAAVTLITQFAEAVPDLAVNIADLAGKILLQLAESFANNSDDVALCITNLITGLGTEIAGHAGDILKWGATIAVNLSLGLLRGLIILISGIPDLVGDMKDAFLSIDWADTGREIITTLWNGAKALWADFMAWIDGGSTEYVPDTVTGDQLLNGVTAIEDFNGTGETYYDVGGEYLTRQQAIDVGALIEGTEAANALNASLEETGTTAEETAEKTQSAANDIMDSLKNMDTSDAYTGDFATEDVSFSGLVDQYNQLAAEAPLQGAAAGQGFNDGISGPLAEAATTAQTTATNITSAFSGLYGEMMSIGANIGNGLVSGMGSTLGMVEAMAARLADAAAAAIKARALIASPSKVTMQYGSYIGEGLAVGIRDAQPMVSSAARSLAGAATDRGSILNGLSVNGGSGGGAPITYNQYITISGSNLTQNDVKKAMQISMADFEKMMDRYQKRRGRVAFA